jgi:hypothetical protein
MSLMVHPAPLIRNEPSANLVQRIVKEMSSGVVVAAAVVAVVVATAAAVADAAVEVEEVAAAAAERSGVYAKAVDHRQGWSSSIVPMGLSSRANRAYG